MHAPVLLGRHSSRLLLLRRTILARLPPSQSAGWVLTRSLGCAGQIQMGNVKLALARRLVDIAVTKGAHLAPSPVCLCWLEVITRRQRQGCGASSLSQLDLKPVLLAAIISCRLGICAPVADASVVELDAAEACCKQARALTSRCWQAPTTLLSQV